ncbi:MAG: hypothetical protein J2P25_07555, partial [Nocardiopsaceae bacterium]|nr:hypothetical protein [Nocardiopsaceae bacterium]
MTESAETYLRRFAEAQLLRLAAGEATAADCASRVDAVAAALEETSALDRERAEDIAAGFDLAVAARSPERDTPLHAGRRSQVSALRRSAGFGAIFARKAPMRSRLTVDNEILAAKLRARGLTVNGEGPGKSRGGTLVVPAGAVLRPRDDGADEDIYLLSYVGTPNSAWLNVAAYTARSRAPRRHASPPSARSAGSRRAGRPTIAGRPTFVGGGMTAVDDAGRQYNLGFSGGGDLWYLGRLSLHPVPPPGISWLEIRCGEQSVRLDLTGAPPCAEVTTRPAANTPGEAYLLGRAEWLLDRVGNADVLARLAAVETTGLASAVPALRAVGVLPDGSL